MASFGSGSFGSGEPTAVSAVGTSSASPGLVSAVPVPVPFAGCVAESISAGSLIRRIDSRNTPGAWMLRNRAVPVSCFLNPCGVPGGAAT